MNIFSRNHKRYQLFIVFCLVLLVMSSGVAWASEVDTDVDFDIVTGTLDAGSYFSGIGQVIIPPGSNRALRVEIEAGPDFAGEEFLVSFPEDRIELQHYGGDFLLATNFDTCLDNNIGRLDSEGRAEFTVGLTIDHITADKASGKYNNLQAPVITVELFSG